MKLPKVKYVLFPRKKNLWGLWTSADEPDPEPKPGKIKLEVNAPPKILMETLIHELLHECFRDVSEEKVERSGKLMAKVMWREGFRRVSQ